MHGIFTQILRIKEPIHPVEKVIHRAGQVRRLPRLQLQAFAHDHQLSITKDGVAGQLKTTGDGILDGGKILGRDFVLQVLVMGARVDVSGTRFTVEGTRVGLGMLKAGGEMLKTSGRETFLQAGKQDAVGPSRKVEVGESLPVLLGDADTTGLIQLGKEPVNSDTIGTRQASEAVVGNMMRRDSLLMNMTMGIGKLHRRGFHVHTGGDGAHRHLGGVPEDTLPEQAQVVAWNDQTVNVKFGRDVVAGLTIDERIDARAKRSIGVASVAGEKILHGLPVVPHRRLLDGSLRDDIRQLVIRGVMGCDVL